MPNLANAKKALRQSLVRAERNSLGHSKIDFMRRSFRKLLEEKKVDEAKKLMKDLAQVLDKAVSKRLMAKNAVARIKGRAMANLAKASAK